MLNFAKSSLVVALMLSLGGHWHVLQLIAWAKMLQDRTPEIGFTEAVASVFGGVHPCERCLTIQQQRRNDQEMPRSLEDSTMKFQVYTISREQFVPLERRVIARWSLGGRGRLQPFHGDVPKPPPRLS